MRIFISHSSRNREIVLKFAEFLEMISSEIEVFCSSESGSIKVGSDFVEKIYEELDNSDLFIPVISNEYYSSRYCMIELGVAYSFLCNKYNKKREEYIFPFSVYPVKKGQALSGTPIANIQTGAINDEKDMRAFLECLSSEKNLVLGSGINRKLHSFMFAIDQILISNQNILDMAQSNTYFDDSIEYRHKRDIINSSMAKEEIVVNFNLNPYEVDNDYKKPNFISHVLGYVDGLNLNRYLDFNSAAEFCFVLTNFTNSLERIFVEFKYSKNNRLLHTFEIPLVSGENQVRLHLDKMRSNALGEVSEICFVIHPDDVLEDEGMYKIGKIKVE